MATKTADWAALVKAEIEPDNQPQDVFPIDRYDEPYVDADGNPAVIRVLGEYSDALKAFDRQMTIKDAENGGGPQTDEEKEQRASERCAAATTGWNIAIGGKEIPFSKENAATLYTNGVWIRTQVYIRMQKRKRFLPVKSSA
jgi:hypothetical protein